ncbi:protein translocase subunit SecD [Candidatus Woesebacteria bacterium]|nr:protein translocase subunit SecD [Candidatus Woesebacteria bacterium]
MSTSFKKFILIVAITLVAGYVSLPPEIPIPWTFNLGKYRIDKKIVRPNLNIKLGRVNVKKNFDLILGLDLAGGSHLVFEADTSKISGDKKNKALESARDIIEKRVNLFGVSEPVVQLSSFEGKNRILVELPGIKDTKQASDTIGKTAQLAFFEVEQASDSAKLKPTDLTGADLSLASVTFDQKSGKPSVSLEFTQEGGNKFGKITQESIGKPVAILLDNQVISAPVVQEKITDGKAVITGSFSLEEVKQLVIQLNAGALPLPIKLVEERTVGATLGQESLSKSIRAGIVGLSAVFIFMVLAYGRMGLVADASLIIFGVITLALYKLIPVVVTLPGVAGFMLSVAMAVDSNILIFERFKEERLKRDFAEALEVSFGRAWNSIRDANVATLITAFVLANPLDWNFLNISGPIRGFAFTLALGIAISLFTGIFVSRNLLRVFIRK